MSGSGPAVRPRYWLFLLKWVVYICWLHFFTTNSETPCERASTASVLKLHPRRFPITDFLAGFSGLIFFFTPFSPLNGSLPLLPDTTWISFSFALWLDQSPLGLQILLRLPRLWRCDHHSRKEGLQYSHRLCIQAPASSWGLMEPVFWFWLLLPHAPGLHFSYNWNHLLCVAHCIMFFLPIIFDTTPFKTQVSTHFVEGDRLCMLTFCPLWCILSAEA